MNKEVKMNNANVNRLNGYYEQFGKFTTSNHDIVGVTPELVKKSINLLMSSNYLYARSRYGDITIYNRDNDSPTGVKLVGSIPAKLEFLLKIFGKTSPLSPTEDLRTTAH